MCEAEAQIFEAGGGYYRATRWESTRGLFLTAVELGEGVAPLPDDIEAHKHVRTRARARITILAIVTYYRHSMRLSICLSVSQWSLLYGRGIGCLQLQLYQHA